MSKNNSETEIQSPIAGFMQLVDAYGCDPQRWPQDRLRAAEMLLRSPVADGLAARRYLAEAAALDRVLDVAPVVDPAQLQLLAERIAAKASASAHSTNIVTFNAVGQRSAKQLPTPELASRSSTRPYRVRVGRTGWAASAVLAASLFLGLSVAPNLATLPGLHEFADAVGFGSLADQLALAANEDGTLNDEDSL